MMDFSIADLKKDGWLLEFVREDEITYEMCQAAAQGAMKHLNDNRSILSFIPKYMRTREICLTVVTADGEALRDVPKELRDRELCLAAVSNYGEVLAFVPESLRDEAMCRAAVDECGRAFWYVPDQYRSKEIALLAVKTSPIVFERLPSHLQSDTDVCIRYMRSLIEGEYAVKNAIYPKHMSDEIFDKIMGQ